MSRFDMPFRVWHQPQDPPGHIADPRHVTLGTVGIMGVLDLPVLTVRITILERQLLPFLQ